MHHAPEATPAAWPLSERLSWLKTFRRGVAAHERELCDLASAETGKPRDETLTTDILPLVSACAWLEKHAIRILKPRGVGGKPMGLLGVRVRIERAPIGRVGIIATWNYPYSLLGQQLCEALIAGSPDAGNAVAVKPSERCPKAQRCLLELAQEAGLPEGVLKVWHHDRDAGRKLVEEGDLDHVVFTGSTAVGRTIAGALGPRLLPSSLELSGRDSAIVLADADVRLAARTIWAAVTLNRGQTCMAPRRAIVDRAVYPVFIEALAERARGVDRCRRRRARAHAHRRCDRPRRAGSRVLNPGRERGRVGPSGGRRGLPARHRAVSRLALRPRGGHHAGGLSG